MSGVLAPSVRIGTRGSRLALVQTALVAERLRVAGATVETVTIETEGDRRAADTPWGEGAFVTAIERSLLDGDIDVAVHSAKDVPTDEDPRLTIAAFLPRERPEDVMVVRAGASIGSLTDVPPGSRVGTDSPRRTAFLRSLRPDLRLHPLHGNVDTRLRRLDGGETDVLVLAAAGLRRLGREDRISAWLAASDVPPAPGQGALAVQVRSGDPAEELVGALDDPDTRRAVLAERRLLAAAGGGCRAPLGALATAAGPNRVHLLAGVATPDGTVAARLDTVVAGDDVEPALLGLAVAAASRAAELGRPKVIVTREAGRAAASMLALVDRGYAPVVVPTIATRSLVSGEAEARALLVALGRADWIVVTSATAASILAAAAAASGLALGEVGARWAAVGAATERAVLRAGVRIGYRPDRATGAALADGLPVEPGQRVVLPRGDLADAGLPTSLAARGAVVDPRTVYETVVAPAGSRELVGPALASPSPLAVLAASPSAVRGWLALTDILGLAPAARGVPVLAIGPTTAAAVTDAGLGLLAEAPDPSPGSVADALRAALPRDHDDDTPDPLEDHG